jgi:hypothetical protein
LLHKLINQFVDFIFGADIDPARGLIEDQNAWIEQQAARQNRLLLVAAAQAANRQFRRGGFDLQPGKRLENALLLGGIVQAAQRAGNWSSAASVMFLPTAMTGTMPSFFGLPAPWRCRGQSPAGSCRFSPAGHQYKSCLPAPRPDAKQALYGFGAPGADQPGDAEDFAAVQRKRDVIDALNVAVNGVPGGQVFHAQHFIAVV